MYYRTLSPISYHDIYNELESLYKEKIPHSAGDSPGDSFTMFTLEELSASSTLVNYVKDLGLYEQWKPGPIVTMKAYSALPVHLDYNYDPSWYSQATPDLETQETYRKFELLRNVQRETILVPLRNCENSTNYFYELKQGKTTTLMQTHQKLYYHVAERKDVEQVADFVLDRPTIFRVDKLHSAVNFSNSTRITLSLRFLSCERFNELKQSMIQAEQ